MSQIYRTPLVLYELRVETLELALGCGRKIPITEFLRSGRVNYQIFQHVVSICAGLSSGTESACSDLSGRHEVKAYNDPALYPGARYEMLQTSASVTFRANNYGPRIAALLEAGDYAGALAICKATGYDKNQAYIYTNTCGYNPRIPLRYIIIPKTRVLTLLSRKDPRLISRRDVIGAATRVVRIDPKTI